MPTTGDLLRAAAAGRREYAGDGDGPGGQELLMEAAALEGAARLADGDLTQLYAWLPSWRWTPSMVRRMREGGVLTIADVADIQATVPDCGEPRLRKVGEVLRDCPVCTQSARVCEQESGCCGECLGIGRLSMHGSPP